MFGLFKEDKEYVNPYIHMIEMLESSYPILSINISYDYISKVNDKRYLGSCQIIDKIISCKIKTNKKYLVMTIELENKDKIKLYISLTDIKSMKGLENVCTDINNMLTKSIYNTNKCKVVIKDIPEEHKSDRSIGVNVSIMEVFKKEDNKRSSEAFKTYPGFYIDKIKVVRY